MKRLTAAGLNRRSLLGVAGGALLSAPLLSLTDVRALAQEAGGGPIRWSLTGVSDLVSLDPAKASNQQDFTVVGILYGGLVRLDEKLLVAPSLAEEWSVSDDSMTYTFTLRDGIVFSDGSPITADDVVWSFNHALDPKTGGWTGPYYFTLIEGADEVAAGKATEVSGVKKVDDKTVDDHDQAAGGLFPQLALRGPLEDPEDREPPPTMARSPAARSSSRPGTTVRVSIWCRIRSSSSR